MTPAPRSETAPTKALLAIVATALDDGKAEDVVTIDLDGKSSIADFMVIATGRSQRQVAAMAERVRDAVDRIGPRPSVEGLEQGDWVLIDAGDVIVHLFRPEVRSYYNLEKMWRADVPGVETAEPLRA